MNATSSLTIRVGTVGIPSAMMQIRGLGASIIRELAGPALGVLSVGGLFMLTKQSINLADTLGKTKQVVGLTVKEISGLSFAAERSEVELGTLRVGLKTFSEWLAKNGQGSKNLKQALLEQSAAFGKMPDGIAKTNRALDLFGKAGLQMIPFLNEGPDGLEKLFEKGERLNGITEDSAKSADEFNDAFSDAKVALTGLAGTIAFSVLPQITAMLNSTTEGIVRFREWAKESKAFEIGLKSVAVTLGAVSAYKLGSLGVGVLAGMVGAGSVTNLRDFIALLQLTPVAAAGAAVALGKVALAIGAITAAVTLAQGWWDYWKAQVQKTDAELMATEANEKLTESLHRRINAEFSAGKVSASEYLALKRRVIEANKLTDQLAQGQELRAIVADNFPAGQQPDSGEYQWTKEELELQNKILDVERGRVAVLREKSKISYEETRDIAFVRAQLKELAREQDLIMDKRHNASEAKNQGVIEKLDYDELDLAVRKELLAIDKERRNIQREAIDSNWRLTEAEKYQQKKNAGIPVDGADPSSLPQQMQSAWVQLQNTIGTIQQQIAQSWVSVMNAAINSTTQSIMGLIDGTMTWQDALRNVGRTIITEVIQSIVRMGVQWVATQLISTIAGKAIAAAGTAALIPIAAAQTAIWTTPAALATIASYGGAAAASPFQVAGAVAATKAITETFGAFGGMRERGGPVTAGMPYIVGEKRAELFVPDQSGYIMPSVPDGYYQGVGSSPNVNVAPAPVHVAVINDQNQYLRFLESRAGERIIVKHIGGNRGELGLQT